MDTQMTITPTTAIAPPQALPAATAIVEIWLLGDATEDKTGGGAETVTCTAEMDVIPNCVWKVVSKAETAETAIDWSAVSTRCKATGSAPPKPAGFVGEITWTSRITDPG